MGQGFDVEQVRRQMKYYEKLDLPIQRSMLQSTCSGAIWPRYRLFMEGMTDDPICPRCEHIGPQVETEYHRYWACPDNANITHPDVISSQYLIPKAAKCSEKLHYIEGDPVHTICVKEYEGGTSTNFRVLPHPQQALWCRGLPINSLMEPIPDDPMLNAHPYPTGACTASHSSIPPLEELDVYTDASGGPNTQFKRLRIVGHAAVVMDPSTCVCLYVLLGWKTCPQTIPAGELQAVVTFFCLLYTSPSPRDRG